VHEEVEPVRAVQAAKGVPHAAVPDRQRKGLDRRWVWPRGALEVHRAAEVLAGTRKRVAGGRRVMSRRVV
jgi:hypothetical protein